MHDARRTPPRAYRRSGHFRKWHFPAVRTSVNVCCGLATDLQHATRLTRTGPGNFFLSHHQNQRKCPFDHSPARVLLSESATAPDWPGDRTAPQGELVKDGLRQVSWETYAAWAGQVVRWCCRGWRAISIALFITAPLESGTHNASTAVPFCWTLGCHCIIAIGLGLGANRN